MRKLDESGPRMPFCSCSMATVGARNALSQVEIFGKAAGVTGLVMTEA